MRTYCLGISLFFLLNTSVALAAVSINEVAWMGGVTSANHEWLELHNSGEAVSVEGWTLSDGMNLNINLTGTISAQTYAVLERTSDDSAPSTAFLIYTGAMVNTGATLTLRDSSGGIVDQVAGGENWQSIGGDNVTKETAQYTASGWVTDVPTPGSVNGAGRVTTPPSSSTTTPVSNSSGSGSKSGSARKSESVNLRNPETKLALKIEAQSIGYVNQLVPFYVTPEGLDAKAERTVLYEWNFGDSYLEAGRRVVHRYAYPGEYLVTVFGRKEKNEQTQTHKITILPVGFSLTFNSSGDVQVHNDTAYDVDISNYVLKGAKEVIFPPRSIILAKATITVVGSRLKKTNRDLVMLYDTSKNLVASTLPKRPAAQTMPGEVETAAQTTSTFAPPPMPLVTNVNLRNDSPEAEVILDYPKEEILSEEPPVPISRSNNVRWPYFALIGLILITYIAVFFGRRNDLVTESKSE